jgi:hypothetical protein
MARGQKKSRHVSEPCLLTLEWQLYSCSKLEMQQDTLHTKPAALAGLFLCVCVEGAGAVRHLVRRCCTGLLSHLFAITSRHTTSYSAYLTPKCTALAGMALGEFASRTAPGLESLHSPALHASCHTIGTHTTSNPTFASLIKHYCVCRYGSWGVCFTYGTWFGVTALACYQSVEFPQRIVLAGMALGASASRTAHGLASLHWHAAAIQ